LVNEVGGAIILAHPYRGRVRYNPNPDQLVDSVCKDHIFDLVDAVEVLNGRSNDKENNFARELCRRLHLRGVGGSDAHSFSDIPSCATLFEKRISNIRELVTELKEGRFKAVNLR